MTHSRLSRICVFCGSRDGARPAYKEVAVAWGSLLARRNIGLVYGGASVGIMGAVADAVLAEGGEVFGFIPSWLDRREIAHTDLTKLTVVETMHERKRLMGEASSAFVALPGGFGTYDELFEVLTWAQIGLHHKPIGILNTDGYFDPLLALVEHTIAEGFAQEANRALFVVNASPEGLLSDLERFVEPATGNKWERT